MQAHSLLCLSHSSLFPPVFVVKNTSCPVCSSLTLNKHTKTLINTVKDRETGDTQTSLTASKFGKFTLRFTGMQHEIPLIIFAQTWPICQCHD